MAIVEGPQALTKVQFDKQIKYLKVQGLPLTMENIDPGYMKFHKEQMNFFNVFRIVIELSVLVFLLMFGGLR